MKMTTKHLELGKHKPLNYKLHEKLLNEYCSTYMCTIKITTFFAENKTNDFEHDRYILTHCVVLNEENAVLHRLLMHGKLSCF